MKKKQVFSAERYKYANSFGEADIHVKRKNTKNTNRIVYMSNLSLTTENDAWKVKKVNDLAQLSVFDGQYDFQTLEDRRIYMSNIITEEISQKKRMNKFFTLVEGYEDQIKILADAIKVAKTVPKKEDQIIPRFRYSEIMLKKELN